MIESLIDFNFYKNDESDNRSLKFSFYNRTIALLVVNNFINSCLFALINNSLSAFFSMSSILFLYLYLIIPKENLIKAKMAMNIAMIIQSSALCVFLGGTNAAWFFLFPIIYTITMFPDYREKKWKFTFLAIAGISFIIWNFLEKPIVLNFGLNQDSFVRLFFRLDVFLYVFLSFMFWTDHSEKNRRKIKGERLAINAILESIPLPIICKDVEENFKIVYGNKAANEYWGNGNKSLIGLKDEDLYQVSVNDLIHFHQLDKESIELKKTIRIEAIKYVKNNGDIKIINLTKIPLSKKYVVTIPEDITESRKTLIEAQNYKSALDQGAIVSFSDLKGRITYVNDKFCEISGYSREELLNRNHRILKSGIHDEKIYSEMWNTIIHGQIWAGELCNKSKSGKLYWVNCTIIPMANGHGQVEKYISIRFDITDRKKAEEQIIQGDKLATLGELSAGIFHEINNPLAILKIKASQLNKSLTIGDIEVDKIQKGLNTLEDNIDRIVRITKGLKSYARNADHDPLEKENLNEIIIDSLVLCADKLKKNNVTLLKEMSEEALYISCRKSEISQVVVNLVNNAVDAIENNEDKWIRISTIFHDNKVILKITDSGNGISSEIVKKIMTPFFTTKSAGRGTGLGLSISLKIINFHGGELSYDYNSPNTCFIITLPSANQIEITKAS